MKPQLHSEARFWDKLPESTREFLRAQGYSPGDTIIPKAEEAQLRSSPATQLARERAEQRRQLTPAQERAEETRRRHAEEVRLTPREKRLRRSMRQAERDRARLAKVRARQHAEFPGHAAPELADVPHSVYVMVRDVDSDPTGAAGRIWSDRCWNKVGVGMLWRAAFVPDASGRTRYTWADPRARSIYALGLALIELSRPTLRKGGWGYLVSGMQLSILCALLADPHEPTRRPSKSCVGLNRHRVGATLESGQVGYLRALQLAGFLYAQQLPPTEVSACERFLVRKISKDGEEILEVHSSNRYWIITDEPTEPRDDDDKRRLVAAHAVGLLAAEQRPQRQARSVYERALELAQARAAARAAPS